MDYGRRPSCPSNAAWGSASGGTSISGPKTPGDRAASPKPATSSERRATSSGGIVSSRPVARGQVPTVHHEVEVHEAVDGLLERRASEEAVELGRRDFRVVERPLHRVARVRDRGDGIVVDRRRLGILGADHPEEHARASARHGGRHHGPSTPRTATGSTTGPRAPRPRCRRTPASASGSGH